ncbi:RHS repeat-associated core domain-containing protein, partial [Cronobacter universalis]|uniref:RHS repeat-associated core domain-containing protein n=1 Tax=Cronobacter universalis TaxID=535744 RepID=UPI0024AFCBAD
FFWDPAGNRTEEHRNPVWHNLLLRLDRLKLDYDGFGRLTRRQDKSGVIQHFAYDDEQRVKEITFTGHAEYRKVEYRYDPLGRRTHKVLWRHNDPQPETIRFGWQGLQLAGEQSDREPDHYVQYVYTEGSYEPLARVDSVFDDCEIYWYHTELNGLPERVTDADGQTVWRGQFSTWGETERELSVPQWQVPQNLRFQGQYLDRESGLHYNLFRYYDPVAGCYTQMDPIGLAGGMNTYSYVGDPLVWVDPLGLEPCIHFNKTHKDSLPKPKGMGPNGGRLQSHHGLQQEWAINNLSQYGYNPKLAPTVTIETGKGLPHTIISNAQNARRALRVAQGQGKWSSSLQDELNNIVTDFRDAGFKDDVIKSVLDQQYKMLDKLNVPYNKVDVL